MEDRSGVEREILNRKEKIICKLTFVLVPQLQGKFEKMKERQLEEKHTVESMKKELVRYRRRKGKT